METFHKRIDLVNPKDNMERYFVKESENVIYNAFDKKSAVHAGLMDKFAPAEKTQKILNEVLNLDRENKTAAYIHVPFCETHCLYCAFYNQPYRKEQSRIYTDALIKEIMLWADKKAVISRPVNALYFGGGTPTALEIEDISRIFKTIHKVLPLANDCEITMEGRISNMTKEKVEAYLAGGVNRFSLGVQSFNTNDIKTAQGLELDGFDCYQLNVFPNTPLGKRIADGSINPALDTKTKIDFFLKSIELMEEAQYRRISVNHWQRTSRERNIYNQFARGYASCLSFGAGAGGNINGYGYMILRDYKGYLEAVNNGIKPVMGISIPDKNYALYKEIAESFETGWADFKYLENKYNLPLQDITKDILNQWEKAGVITLNNGKVILTKAGQFWFVNLSQLMQEFIKLTIMFNEKDVCMTVTAG